MKKILSVISYLAVLAFISCQRENPTGVSSDQFQGTTHSGMTVSFLTKDAPPEVAEIIGRVSRFQYDTVVSKFIIGNDIAYCEFDNLAAGTWHLEVNAYDGLHRLSYTGQTDVQVFAGVTTPVNLQLNPATGSISVTVTWGTSDTTSSNNAIRFGDGGGSIVISPSSDFRLQQLTVEMFVQVNNTDTTMVPFLYETGLDHHSQADGYSVKWERGRLYFRVAESFTDASGASGMYSFKPGTWVHISCTYDHNAIRIYVNGNKLVDTLYNADIYYGNNGFSFGIGHHSDFGWLFNLKGMMDEIRIWNYARTGDQIRDAMQLPLQGNESGLVAYWNCNQKSNSTILYDRTSRHHNGYVTGDVSFVASQAFSH